MKIFNTICLFIIGLSLTNCTQHKLKVTDKKDYESYLKFEDTQEISKIQKESNFWSEKLNKAPNQFPYLAKIAAAESNLFDSTGKIEYLISAEKNLLKLNEKTGYNNAGSLRSLAINYISQHKFKAALELLLKAEKNGEKLQNTKKMLFDIHLELGNYSQAENYLTQIKNENNFDYLIRLSKWSDHKGYLNSAIHYMEKAAKLAVKSKNKSLMQWSYTNLADFYGHANRIEESYNFYLKSLELNPNDAYAKKGIAWIVYSYEKNPKEAMAILNTITENYNSPDYYLLKAEIAEFTNNSKVKDENINSYLLAVKNKNYGNMYNKYDALLFTDELNDSDKALGIAKKEIQERATPQSYDLLAWSYYNKGNIKKALEIVEKNIADKTFEPEVQYHMAKIYKANGMEKNVVGIKKELLESTYELGPLMEAKIQLL